MRTKTIRTAIAAICVAAAMPTLGETAKWTNTNGGNMNTAANWEN